MPVLKEVKSKEIKKEDAGPINIIIEGENYHALTVLNYTHQAKVDVIYIDPPYNTGAKDWKYNNKYVDINDTYRHSKWLSMMDKRLRQAKALLKRDGVLICAIDENEVNRLGLLLEEIFADHELHCITIIHNPRGQQGKNFSYMHEYAYFSFKKGLKVIGAKTRDELIKEEFRDHGGESKRTDARNCFYPILVKNQDILGFGSIPSKEYHPKSKNIHTENGIIEVWPIDRKGIERKWVFAVDTVEKIKSNLYVKTTNTGEVDIFRIKDTQNPRTVWSGPKYDASTFGSKLVNGLTGSEFPFPKSLYTTKDCLECVIRQKKNAVVLDYFAGSGTTGHAVMLMNKDDGGKRQFILITNNENGIATDVCYPRIKAVIKGHDNYPDITGIPASLKYFKTAYVKKSLNRDDMKFRITNECTEMLCLREGIYAEIRREDEYRIFIGDGKVMAVYYALERDSLKALRRYIATERGEKILYCFTLDPLGLNQNDFEDWRGVRLEPIPQKILDIYEQIYEY